MARRLSGYVHVVGPDGVSVGFGPDDDVPDWAAAKITNPKAWTEMPGGLPATTTPRAGGAMPPAGDPPPIARFADAGATDEELGHLRALWAELSEEGRAETLAGDAEISDKDLVAAIDRWRAKTSELGGDVAAGLEAVFVDQGDEHGPPPRSGTGSGREAWIAYARAKGFEVDDDARRDDVIEQLAEAGVPVE